jgi:signal transduction histidine kinase
MDQSAQLNAIDRRANSIDKFVPVFTDAERRELILYYRVLEKYRDEITAPALKKLEKHPVFGKLIRETPPEVAEATRLKSNQLQHDAIINNNWHPYIKYQFQQGGVYAKMGLDFKSWYDMVGLAREYLMPCILKEYADSDRLLSAISGMNQMMDLGMCVIGEAYLREKQAIIEEEKKTITELNDGLEAKVFKRTSELEALNKELDSFTYSVSHDLRAPLRAVNGYAEMLNEDFGEVIGDEGKRIIQTIRYNAIKMGTLIDDLLAFSRLGRKEINKSSIDMNELVQGTLLELNKSMPNKAVIDVGELHHIEADYGLMSQVMLNLLSNAVKYSSKKEKPVIEIRSKIVKDEIVFSVKDNGAGFDMRYADKLFGVFQRLHSQEDFEGVGVGLAIVQRVINRHGGKVWAEGKVNEGATFSFSFHKN